MPVAGATTEALAEVGLAPLGAAGDALSIVRLKRGEALLHAGGEADAVYALLAGRLLVHPERNGGPPPVAVPVEPGAIIGETAILTGGGRTGTVVASAASRLVRIEAARFAELLDADEALAAVVAEETMQRLRRVEFNRHVGGLLGPMDPDAMAALASRCAWVHLRAGTTLFRQGDAGDAAYLVLTGRLVARTGTEERARELGRIGPGELVGESSLLEDARRTASVVAVRDSELARLDRRTFEDLLREHPTAGLAVARGAVQRSLEPRPRTRRSTELSIAVVPVGATVDVRRVTSALVEALRSQTGGEVAHLWAARVDSRLAKSGISQRPPDDPAGRRLTTWLHEIETQVRFLVWEADPSPSTWNERALRWSDLVLLVADASTPPQRTDVTDAVWRALADEPRRTALTLLHPATVDGPRDTAAWLSLHPVVDVHHVRSGSVADVARLSRVASGTGVGVALSGGGARGFAHLGVLRALREAGIPVDVAGGTSMGAVVASACAMDLSHDEMMTLMVEGFRDLLDYTLPIVSLVKGERIVRAMRGAYAERHIEDLWRTYFCVSSNLTRSETVVHRRGPMVEAVRASVAIPGIIPPVPYGGDLLVDGGVLNNLPVDELVGTGLVGTSIAVDVTPKDGPRAKADFGLSVSGGRVLAGRLRGGRHPAPGLTRVLLRSMLLGAMRDRDRQVEAGTADLFLDLDLRGIDLLDFDAVERAASAGYDAAAPRIEAWLAGETA